MRIIKNFVTIFLFLIIGSQVFAAKAWLNDLKTLYTNNQAIIYEINIRTFNANDKDGNGIITNGEEKGNFINAAKRITELSDAGINTIKLLPILPVSKTHALGTAGSLFAPVEFDKINPQLKTPKGSSVYQEFSRFINICHKNKIRVIVDLPCCAGYDLYSKNPKLFLKDVSGNPITPLDNDDVRILDSLNNDVYELYKTFITMMFELGVDGISVQMPETKSYDFWKKLISETRKLDPEMLFLAETNPNSQEIFKNARPITPVTKLLEAGFDGYSGNYNNITTLKQDLYQNIKSDIAISQKFNKTKSVYTNFASYDNVSPTATNGADYAKQLIWLESTLPFNLYYIDGFSTGDNYMYPLSNKSASSSMTDDKKYYMKRGQIDIYNFSRKPEGDNFDIYSEFVIANRFRIMLSDVLTKGNFILLKNNNPNIFSFARSLNNSTVVVITNLEKTEVEKVKVKIPKINQDIYSVPIKNSANIPTLLKGEIQTKMAPLEIQIILFQNFSIK